MTLDLEPVGIFNDYNNNWLDGRTQKNLMLKSSSQQNFGGFRAEAESFTDSVFIAVENHLVAPYDDPMIPYLTLSTKHFWTINRYDFGDADVTAMFDFSKTNDGDIIQTENDSATILYRRDARESWHEIAYTYYPGSTWRNGRIIVDDFQPGEYAIAVWDKEALGQEELVVPEKKVQIYPNPSDGHVRMSWNGAFDGQIRIVGMDGKEMRRMNFLQADHVEFSTLDLPKGCHTVMCLDKNGSVIAVEKLIIK